MHRQPVADDAGGGGQHGGRRHGEGASQLSVSTVRTSSSPAGPVRALALPALTRTAWMPEAGRRGSASRTGAALALFWVKQPAAEQGVSL